MSGSSKFNNLEIFMVFRPKPYEVDFTGFISNTVATKWMEDLRVSMTDKFFPQLNGSNHEHISVIADTHVKYIKPVSYSDIICGHAWIDSIAHSRWTIYFKFSLKDTNLLVMEGQQIGVFINRNSLMPIRIPEEIKNLFNLTKNYLMSEN